MTGSAIEFHEHTIVLIAGETAASSARHGGMPHRNGVSRLDPLPLDNLIREQNAEDVAMRTVGSAGEVGDGSRLFV